MAQKYITVKTSDLSGADLLDGAGDTLTFAVGRSSYVIDLTDEEVGGFYDVLKPYIDAARKADAGAAAPKTKASSSKKDLAAIRTWANDNGFTVSARGRVPSAVLEAYEAAN